MLTIVAADIIEGDVTTRRLLVAAAVAIVGILVASIAKRVVRRVLLRGARDTRMPVDATAASLVARIVQAVVAAFAIVYALYLLGVQVGPLATALGVGGLAVAIALRETLENVIAGIVLQLRRPFVLGDRVVLGADEGRIVDIGFRYVQLARVDGSLALIPARRVLDGTIVNVSEAAVRRATAVIPVAPGPDAPRLRERIAAAVGDAPGVLETPAPQALLRASTPGQVEVVVHAWHDPEAVPNDEVVDAIVEHACAALPE
jgi:small-conductance mechanosensitive channel